jgi:hypothetical protein
MHSIRSIALLAVTGLVAFAAAMGCAGHRAVADTQYHVLFDAAHAETAGNADWVVSTSQPDPTGENPNPQDEKDWTGGLSAWGVALQKSGSYTVRTNPAGTALTYGGSGTLDLSGFDALVLPEPNTSLSAAERTAVVKFVQAGGGLFMVSDHNGSDRNNDGIDSVGVLNQLMTSNGVDDTDPFGITIEKQNIADENPSNIPASASDDPVIKGANGTVTGAIMRNGTTATLSVSDDAGVKGLLYRDSADSSGSSGVFFATSTFGEGRVAFWGDSSPVDDGTGASGDTLYDGWDDPAGTDATLALNATDWLVGRS